MSYGYKRSTTEQLQNSVIDWAGITKNVSDRIIKETERRDNLKAELETTYNNQLDALNDYQQGLDVEANAFMMQQVQNHKAFLKQNHDLMKAGLRSVNDNKLIQTNVSNTWKRLNSAMKGHQEAFKKFSESGKTGDLALAEFLADSINVKDKQIYLSETGEGYLAAVDDKGVIDKSSLQAIRSIEQVQASEWDSIDVNAAVLKDANGAAVWKRAITSTTDIEDVRQNPEFKEWKENTITKSLNNDQRIFSVLTDYMGYDYTYNPDEVDENTVLLKKDKNNGFPTPELTEDQRTKAREAYGNALEMALGRKEDKQYVAPTTQTAKLQEEANVVKIIDDFVVRGQYSGLKATLGQVASNVTLDEEDKTLTVELLDGLVKTIDLNRPQRDIGVEIAGIIDPKTAGTYRNKGAGSLTSSVNQKALDTKTYTPISTKTKLSGKEIDTFNKQLSPIQTKDFVTDKPVFTLRPDLEVKSAVTAVARKLQLDPNQVTVTNGVMMYGDTQLGAVGTVTGTEVAQKLETIASGTKGRFDDLNTGE